MTTTVRVTFDGEVLRPEQPLFLPINTTYVVTIEHQNLTQETELGGRGDAGYEHPLTRIRRLAVDMGVDDLSINHEHYAPGAPKIGEEYQ